MTNPTAPVSETQARSVLEAFVTENPELERLESLLAQFNIFEALGAVRHEVRHSDFLAYLLNPQENHGLGDAFIKRLLQKAIGAANSPDLPVTLVDLDFWDLGVATVQREWQRIDIFLRDEVHQLSVIIENKIDTGEHDDQLARYYDRVRHEFPADHILALYLTKEGDEPTDDRYLAVGYGLVCEAVEHMAERRASTLGPDVRTLMVHYAQMLRRHIMSDTEIARLCGLIYQKHKAALDLIYEHQPDLQLVIGQFMGTLIAQEAGLRLERSGKSRLLFGLTEWDIAPLLQGTRWTESGRILLFEIINIPILVRINLWVGPGPTETREKLIAMARSKQPPFKANASERGRNHKSIYTRTFLRGPDYEEAGVEELEAKLSGHWADFIRRDLPRITSAVKEESWLWEDV